jgi:xanthine dehydrogenase YagS FAD-binding subunit
MLFELPSFDHIDARTREEAADCLCRYGKKAKVIAGATDLLGLMKDRLEGPELKIPEVLVNVKTISNITRIAYEPEAGLTVGAAVTLQRLLTDNVIHQHFPILSQAARQIGTTPLRYMGTVGGNLCQRPRCLYFRHPHFPCFKKGGTKCFAASGEHRHYHSILKNGKCVMAHPSDLAPALIALQSRAVIFGSPGERTIPLEEFFLGPDHCTEVALKGDEFLTQIQVPVPKGKTFQLFLKERMRHSADFALSSVATVLRTTDGFCEDLRIVLGGIAPFPYLVSKVESIARGKKLDEELASAVAEAALEGSRPLPMNQYKVDLTKTLVRRSLQSA